MGAGGAEVEEDFLVVMIVPLHFYYGKPPQE
jgi:hypothetical protein